MKHCVSCWINMHYFSLLRFRISAPWFNTGCRKAKVEMRQLAKAYWSSLSMVDYRKWWIQFDVQRWVPVPHHRSSRRGQFRRCTVLMAFSLESHEHDWEITLQTVWSRPGADLANKKCCDLPPTITTMIRMTFRQGVFPYTNKYVFVQPRIKKTTLDTLNMKSFWLISNLNLLSKRTERLAVNRFNEHTDQYHMMPSWQLAYTKFHSTKTAFIIVHNDIPR